MKIGLWRTYANNIDIWSGNTWHIQIAIVYVEDMTCTNGFKIVRATTDIINEDQVDIKKYYDIYCFIERWTLS